jgi:hypothetical protein
LTWVERRLNGFRGGIGGVRLSVSVEAICSKLQRCDNHPAAGDGADDGRGLASDEDDGGEVDRASRAQTACLVGSAQLNERGGIARHARLGG